MNYKILIVDDEEDICEILQFNLQGEGYDAEVAYSAEEALEKKLSDYNLILLDVMMDKMSGFAFANKIRKEKEIKTPIIFLTAKTTENDLLTGFNVGADDYITKPFSIKEVLARVNAVIKRSTMQNRQQATQKHAGIDVDLQKKLLIIDGTTVNFTKKEFEIVTFLMDNKDKIFSRDDLINQIWEENTVVTSRTVDVHITRIRKKLGKYADCLSSKSGYGYTFKSPQN